MGVTGGSIGREKEVPIRRQRRLDSICGMSAVPVVDKVIGAKRKTIVGVDGRDCEITEEESKSPWFPNKNPTGYGNAKDVARALVINQRKREQKEREKREQRKTDEEIVEKALNQAGGEMMSIDVKVAMKDHVLLPAEVVERLLPEIAKRLHKEDKK